MNKIKSDHNSSIYDYDNESISWIPMECAVCRRDEEYKVVYNENISIQELNFSARKTPALAHARIVKCRKCGLVYSNPFLTQDKLNELYASCEYIIEPQIENYCDDYKRQLKKVSSLVYEKGSLLEIGCGNGFFLREAKNFGFKKVCGIEPGKQAVEMAYQDIKKDIVNDIFKEGLFEENSFDVVCIFQVIDHIPNPNEFISLAYKLIKPGGALLAINHNIKSLHARVLGRRCPMIDIEHIYLFDKHTISKILSNHGFKVETIESLYSTYSVEYIVKMFPFPISLKSSISKLIDFLRINNFNIKFPGGNMVTIARKYPK